LEIQSLRIISETGQQAHLFDLIFHPNSNQTPTKQPENLWLNCYS